MKSILLSVSVILLMASCQNKAGLTNASGQSQIPIVPVYNNAVFADTAKIEEAIYKPVKYERAKQVKPKRMVRTATPRTVVTETTSLPAVEGSPVQTPPVVTAPAATPAAVGTPPAGVGKSENTETIETIPQPEEKKGWSSAAKGTVIGAGAGAIGGAIFSKKKGKGAIIGGIIGAAGGYAIGKGMDKKDNRLMGE